MTLYQIKHIAHLVGFDACGVTPPHIFHKEHIDFMSRWVKENLPQKLSYLARNEDVRYHPINLVPQTKTVIVCLLSYEKCKNDYHRRIKSMFYEMQTVIESVTTQKNIFSPGQHVFCDSAPVLERCLATQAGLGWIGKNHQLIHPTLGAKTHIGEMFINVDIPSLAHVIVPQCHQCHVCIDACPNHALGKKEWRAEQCLAFINNKCTICQQVCPYNP